MSLEGHQKEDEEMNDEISSPGKENMLKQLCIGMENDTLQKVDPAKLR